MWVVNIFIIDLYYLTRSSLYVLDISPLSDMHIVNIFSVFGLPFHVLREQKFDRIK